MTRRFITYADLLVKIATISLLICLPTRASLAQAIHHYVFFELDRARIHEPTFLGDSAFEGAQLKYTWRELEPEPDRYDFHSIRDDLAFLTERHKRLWIQVQDVTFTPASSCVPDYLRHDSAYHGGANRQFDIPADDESKATVDGWIARRWDPAVEIRFQKLLAALGREFDGKVSGINLAETAAEFGVTGRLYPPGFTPSSYQGAILADMKALKNAFPKSVTMIYANFMPGEWLPWTDHHYLASVYERAGALGVGVAGPDLLPYKKGQMSHSYPLIARSHGRVATGIAVQEGNYGYINPRTKKRITIGEQFAFAKDYLKVTYMFWYPEEPYFASDVLPFLHHRMNTD